MLFRYELRAKIYIELEIGNLKIEILRHLIILNCRCFRNIFLLFYARRSRYIRAL